MSGLPASALVAVVLVATAPAGAAGPSTTAGRADLELLGRIRELASRLEEIRGVAGPEPAVARADASAREAPVREDIRRHAGSLDALGRAWADIGLGVGDGPERLAEILALDLGDIAVDGNAVMLDPSLFPPDDFRIDGPSDADAQVLLATGVRPDEPLVVHALVHVADGAGPWTSIAPTTDERLAAAAVAEGEANLHAVRLLFSGMGLADDVVQVGLDPASVLDGRLVPASLRDGAGTVADLVRFVYLDGFDAVARAWSEGGAASVLRYRRRVAASRDVLHPDRVGRPVVEPTLPGGPDVQSPTVRDRIGEQGIVVLVSRGTGKDNLGLIAGDGWAGDTLARWESGPDDPTARTVWSTAWTDDEEARDFAYAYRRVLEVRVPGGVPDDAPEDRFAVADDRRRWSVTRDGATVRVEVTRTGGERP